MPRTGSWPHRFSLWLNNAQTQANCTHQNRHSFGNIYVGVCMLWPRVFKYILFKEKAVKTNAVRSCYICHGWVPSPTCSSRMTQEYQPPTTRRSHPTSPGGLQKSLGRPSLRTNPPSLRIFICCPSANRHRLLRWPSSHLSFCIVVPTKPSALYCVACRPHTFGFPHEILFLGFQG